MKKITYIIGVILFLSIVLFAIKGNLISFPFQQNKYEKSEIVMDTFVTLTAYGQNAKKAVEDGFTRIEEIDRMASATNPTSDIYKINKAAGIDYVEVHPEIIKMIQTSLQYSKLSNGAFDISVGPLIQLWGIGTDQERIPTEEEIQSVLSLVNYTNILVKENENSVMLLKQGMGLELGAVAKGFACDEVRKIFETYHIKDALINLGSSSIDTMGKNEEKKSWGIGIKHPRDKNTDQYLAIIKTSNEALSTSGDYERYFIKDQKRYHHILDPKTGYPADNGIMSTSIVIDHSIPDNAMLSDILSTVAFVLGKEEGIHFMERLSGVSCEITGTDFKIYTSEGFDTRIENLNKEFEFKSID